MTNLIDYTLDEFVVYPGMSVYVYSVAQISYKWEGRDRDTGYCGGPYDIELQHLTIEADLAKDAPHAIEQTHPLFLAIEAALQNNDHVIDACVADHEQN